MPHIPLNILEQANTNEIIEIIIKYHGDISNLGEELNGDVDILNHEYAIITIPADEILALSDIDEIEYLELPKTLVIQQALFASCADNFTIPTGETLTGSGVLIGIIDSGIDYTHPDFLNEDGSTRIKYIWDQSILDGIPPANFSFGNVFTEVDINNSLVNNIPLGHEDNNGHGTAVAGIAGGSGIGNDGEFFGIARDASFVIVKLSSGIIGTTTNSTELMRGIKFVYDVAMELSMPLVVNISFGTNEGSHDGLSLFETYIDSMESMYMSNIVIATGNEGNTSHHFADIIMEGETIDVKFNIVSGLKSCFISLWKTFVDNFSIELISPSGRSTGVLQSDSSLTNFTLDNYSVYIFYGTPTPYNAEQEIYIQMEILNSSDLTEQWTLRIYGIDIVDGRFNIWLPINESVSLDTSFLSPSLDITLTIPSTSYNAITVGGYNHYLNSLAPFSGRGFTRDERVKPDLVAPCLNVYSTKSGGGFDTFTGTSFAAPYVTGTCACLMEWGIIMGNDPYLYGQRMKAYLRLGATREADGIYPNREWGYGKLCGKQTLEYLVSDIRNMVSDEATRQITIEDESIQIEEINIDAGENYIDCVMKVFSGFEDIIESYDGYFINLEFYDDLIIAKIPASSYTAFILEVGTSTFIEPPLLLGLMGKAALDDTGITAIQNQPFLQLTGSGVLVGIIDTGIDYTNESFIYEDNSSKILYLWDQSTDTTNVRYTYGTEYTKEDIDRAINSENPLEIVPQVDEEGHGTFLASIVAGRQADGDVMGAAPDANIICVKLRKANEAYKDFILGVNREEAYQSTDIMTGISYIYSKARELNRPVAIVLGMGTNMGGHDGSTFFEEYLGDISGRGGVCIAVASGNEGSSKLHYEGLIESNGEFAEFEFEVANGESTFMINIRNYEVDIIEMEVISPLGESTDKIPFRNGSVYSTSFPLEDTIIIISYNIPYTKIGNQTTRIIFKKPTPGIWKIRLHGQSILNGTFHAWLPIKNFINEGTFFLTPTPDFTITTPATLESLLSVGGYSVLSGGIYADTGRGPNRIMENCVDIISPSVNVTGMYPYGVGIMTGTSVGAAIATGAAALLLEWGIVNENELVMNTQTITQYLTRGARRQPNTVYPNYVEGFGKLDLENSFRMM